MPSGQKQQVVTSGAKDNKALRLLAIIFVVIFVIVLAELGYYFFTKRTQTPTPTPISEAQDVERAVKYTPPPSEQNLPSKINIDKYLKFADQLEFYNKVPGLITSSDILLTLKGQIVSTSGNEEVIIDENEYPYLIQVRSSQNAIVNYRFTQEEADQMFIILLKVGTTGQAIKFEELMPNDEVVIKETINLLESSPYSKLVLEVRR